MATVVKDKGLEIKGNIMHKNLSFSLNQFDFNDRNWPEDCSPPPGRLAPARPSDNLTPLEAKFAGVYDHQEANTMSRFTFRLLPLLVLFVGFSAVARADSFQITFAGNATGTGQFTTDGICTVCSPTAGLQTWVVAIGPDTGSSAFDIVDDGPATVTITYDRSTNTLSSIGTFNSENNDFLIFHSDLNLDLSSLAGDFSGTYTVSPSGVPEPPTSVLLLLSWMVLAAGKALWNITAARRRRLTTSTWKRENNSFDVEEAYSKLSH